MNQQSPQGPKAESRGEFVSFLALGLLSMWVLMAMANVLQASVSLFALGWLVLSVVYGGVALAGRAKLLRLAAGVLAGAAVVAAMLNFLINASLGLQGVG